MCDDVWRMAKALLFIVMLVGAEVNQLQHARHRLHSGVTAGSANSIVSNNDARDPDLQPVMAWMASPNLKEPGELVPTLAEGMTMAKALIGEHQKHTKRIASQTEVVMPDGTSQDHATTIAQRKDGELIEWRLQDQTKQVADQIKTMMADVNFRSHSKLQEVALTTLDLENYAKLIADQMEELRTNWNFEKQWKQIVQQMLAMLDDSDLFQKSGAQSAGKMVITSINRGQQLINKSRARLDTASSSAEVHNAIANVIDNLVDRRLKATPAHHADLRGTAHENPGHRCSSRGESKHPLVGCRPHLRYKRTLIASTPQTRAKLIAARSSASAEANSGDVQLSSVPQLTVNLMKNIVGSGMLALPAGVAACSGSPKALVPAATLVLTFGLVSAYGFILIADVCRRTHESTFDGAWGKTVSESSKWLPVSACVGMGFIICIAFSMILGDCFSLILSPLSLPTALKGRSQIMVALTVSALFPLCMMKSLASLARFSALGVLSNVYVSFFILLRCFDGSYRGTSRLLAAAPVVPKFALVTGNAFGTVINPGVTVLIGVLGSAYHAHINAPMYWEQLAPDAKGNKFGKFIIASILGFSGSALIFCAVMAGGFLTFGSSSFGLILNNYAATDSLATLARLGIAVSLVTCYPLIFLSLKKQIIGMLGEGAKKFDSDNPRAITILLLGAITSVAAKLTDLGKLAAFSGATFCSFLIYIAPAMMSLGSQQRGLGSTSTGLQRAGGYIGHMLLILLGLILGVIGGVQSLK